MPNDNNIARRDVTLVRLATLIADSGSFGNVCVGSFKDEMLYLSNSGFNRVTVTAVTSSSAEFVVPSVLSYPLNIAPGSFLEVPIRFEPGSFGPKSGDDDDRYKQRSERPRKESLGDAKAPRLAVIIADSGNFGNACVGSFAGESVILSNSGQCTLSVLSLTSSSGEFLIPNVLSYPLTIAAGGSRRSRFASSPRASGPNRRH